jgi:hypothetical protein
MATNVTYDDYNKLTPPLESLLEYFHRMSSNQGQFRTIALVSLPSTNAPTQQIYKLRVH